MIKISITNCFIFILFSISTTIYGEDKDKPINENKIFNENLPAQISIANSEFIYKFLLAEIATQRGELNTAGHVYLDLAKLTKNIPLAERATRIAGTARNARLAMDSAEVWRKLDKTSIEPQRILAELFITSGNLAKARPLVKKLLEKEEKTRGEGFLYLNKILSQVENKKNALRFIIDISKPYLNIPEARFAIAHAAFSAGNKKQAIEELDKIESINPKWETAALFRGYIIGREWPEKSLAFYQDFLRKNPKSNEVRLEYAKALTNLKKYDEAKTQFLKLVNSSLASSEISLTVALLAIEMGDTNLAEKYFLQSLERGYPKPAQIHIYLAGISDEKGDFEAALTWLKKINNVNDEYFIDSRILMAEYTAKYDSVDLAIEMLTEVKKKRLSSNERLIILRNQSSLLIAENRNNDAYDLMKMEEDEFKDSPEFKFDYAMLSERMGNTLLMEQLLLEAIKLKPDYATAYNALGYSYADRGIKLEKAKRFIEVALSFEPNNHYILDSMGWIHFKLGNLEIGLQYIKKAYAINKDPEIAAHLGEILWVQGKKEEAKKIWKNSLNRYPSNTVLKETENRFK
jgi:tetratricopeptide (TPR) repeat protein